MPDVRRAENRGIGLAGGCRSTETVSLQHDHEGEDQEQEAVAEGEFGPERRRGHPLGQLPDAHGEQGVAENSFQVVADRVEAPAQDVGQQGHAAVAGERRPGQHQGDAGRGLVLLAKAADLAPQAGTIRLNLAKALIKAGKKTEAKQELEALAKLGDRFAEQAEVTALLKGL